MSDPDINLNSGVIVDDETTRRKDNDNNVPVAEAIPLPGPARPSFSTSHILSQTAFDELRKQGFPAGLAYELGNNTISTHPLRFWVIDNSGSMRTSDGHEIRQTIDPKTRQETYMTVPCTRWKELQSTVEYHAELAGILQATTIFRLLNNPGRNIGPQEFSIGEDNSQMPISKEIIQAISIIRRTEPAGVTPLTYHLNVILERIQSVANILQNQGQRAVIIIATDGLPSDDAGRSTDSVKQEFVEKLRHLQSLPVWVVVRLCTDDNDVVNYYNSLDESLELPIEVIDDYLGEAEEINACNKWLNYTLPLHRCREMGYQHRIFDLLDERVLNKDELREFFILLFGNAAFQSAPDIHSDWYGFTSVLENIIKTERREWNPYKKCITPWIDMKQLHKIYGDKRGLFGIFGKKKKK